VTFLFTDIEDSSRRWEDQPAAMSSSLARHDELLRQAISASRGVVFSRAGDGVAAVLSLATAEVVRDRRQGWICRRPEPNWPHGVSQGRTDAR
jgi:class 3 adenylate cyclase